MFLKGKIIRFLRQNQYVSNDLAVKIIRDFANGAQKDPYAWDDLETTNHSNPEVELAVRVCWYYAGEYPAKTTTEYCGEEAKPYFLAVANALENGKVRAMQYSELFEVLERGGLPHQIKVLLETAEE